jgi:hypothetical protein
MNIPEDIQLELDRDGPTKVITMASTDHGTHILFQRQVAPLAGLTPRYEIRSAFFDATGNTRYNMIVG